MSTATILVVDDDEVLSKVLRRVLSREGYHVVEAGSVAQALEVARGLTPQLALLDLSLPDGDGMELAKKLRAQGVACPLILVTAYPLRLRDQPELSGPFLRVLTKPLNLQELRQAIEAALAGPAAAAALTPLSEPPPESDPVLAPPVAASVPVAPPPPLRRASGGRGRAVVLVGAILVGAAFLCFVVIFPALGLPGVWEWFGKEAAPTIQAADDRGPSADLVSKDPGGKDYNSLRLAPEVADRLGVKTAEAAPPKEGQELTLSGSLNLDPDYLAHIHPRFSGEVIEVGKYKAEGASIPSSRPLRFGDPVSEGQLLAVIWSKDLGEKKNDLIEGLAKLWTDKESLAKLEQLFGEGATPEANVRLQRSVVAADLSAVDRARNALRIWRLTDEEIRAVEKDAKDVFDQRTRTLNSAGDKAAATTAGGDWTRWARLEVRAPFNGTVVERNIAATAGETDGVRAGELVDVTADLFKIADMKHLVVWAHAYEQDLPLLQDLPRPIPWTVRLSSDPTAADRKGRELKSPGADRVGAVIDEIGPLIDPNEHTALVVGRVDNSDPEHRLKAGQFVAATIRVPPPRNVVAVPSTGVVEDGSDSVVFVQPDPKAPQYAMKRVKVVRRTQDWVWVLSANGDDKDNKESFELIRSGDRVVTDGAVTLKSALEDLQDRARAEAKTAAESRQNKKKAEK